MKRWVVRACVLGLVVLAGAGLWSAAGSRPASPDAGARSVAATMRCPTCITTSVADSTAPLAEGMRAVIQEQVDEGRTPTEIQAWFVDRYGEDILLEPPRRGVGLSLWLLPFAAAPVAAWLVMRGRRRPLAAWLAGGASLALVTAVWVAFEQDHPVTAPAAEAPASHPIRVLERAVRESPGDVEVRVALARALDRAERYAQAATHYQVAARLAPSDDSVLYRTAFSLVRAGRSAEAVPHLDRLLERSPDHAEGLLLLATIYHENGDPAADALLARFLDVSPDHPGAEQAEIMLNGDDRE